MQLTALGGTVAHFHNVLDPREREVFSARVGATLDSVKPDTRLPVMCQLNGEFVLAEDWPDIVLVCGDHAMFHVLPLGGGEDASSAQVVIGIVLIVVGVVVPGAQALIGAGAALLLSGLLPQPDTGPISQPNNPSETSPTYTINLSGNTARLGQPIPVPYGRHIIVPDFGANPYSTFDNVGDQYYHALFCFGAAARIAVQTVTIDDTVLQHFTAVQTQLVGPSFSPALTLIDPAVVNAPEVANQELIFGTYVGPFASSGAGLLTNQIGIDIVCPRGLYFANNNGELGPKTITWLVEARQITDSGAPAGSWFPLGLETLTLAQNNPVRRSYEYSVTPARYEVRVQRQEVRDTNTRAGHEINWVGLRSRLQVTTPLESAANYFAVRIKATNQLSGLSQRRFALVVQRELPTLAPTGPGGTLQWTAPVATRSIAWAIADVLRNQEYGAQLPDNRIDLQTLYELDQVWAARGDYFNGVFDALTTVWEAITRIARCGRARPFLRGNVVSFVRDQRADLPVALFSMRNIKRGSFSISYKTPDPEDPDSIRLSFFNERTWSEDFVIADLPGIVGPSRKPANITIKGITSRRQAQREAAYMAADAVYRSARLSLTTELEGYLPALGEPVAISHDLTGWGVSGDIEEHRPLEKLVICSEEPKWSPGTNYFAFVNEYGDLSGPYEVTQGPEPRSMLYGGPLTDTIYTGTERERTRFVMGSGAEYARLCVITDIVPAADDSVQVSAIVEDNRVHLADAAFLGDDSVGGPGGGGPGGGGPGSGGTRVAHYAPAGLLNYNGASDEQRARYGYYTRVDRTVGTNNDPGYVYDT